MKQSKKLTREQKIQITKSLMRKHEGLKQDEAEARFRDMTPEQRNAHLKKE